MGRDKKNSYIRVLLKKYSHGWVFLYWLIYLPWFYILEKKVNVYTGYHIISSSIDSYIPFVEYFVVPYVMWFFFIAAVSAYFFLRDKEGFYRFSIMMYAGMTVFLVISTLFPNGLEIRPYYFEHSNVFTDMVRTLYMTDTPTNVFPSLHVYNTLAACVAIADSEKLKTHKVICGCAYILSVLIILSTMFIKQHSVVDVMGAFVMAYIFYRIVYVPQGERALAFHNTQ